MHITDIYQNEEKLLVFIDGDLSEELKCKMYQAHLTKYFENRTSNLLAYDYYDEVHHMLRFKKIKL